MDQIIEATEATISHGVCEMACRLNRGSSSFQATSENLARCAHLSLSKETLRGLIECEGRRVLAQPELPDWKANECTQDDQPSRVYLGCDGVKVPTVTDVEKRKRRTKVRTRRQARGGKLQPLPRAKPGADCSYKEVRLVILYDEPQQHRWVRCTRGDHEVTGRLMRRMAGDVQLQEAQERVALIDGAPWIRARLEFHELVETIGLDFYHLRDNVQKARQVIYGDSEAGRIWTSEQMRCFRDEGYQPALERLLQQRVRLRGAKRVALDRLLAYVTERREMIDYPEFRRRGWQIGSGPTEAQCKSTTGRVKGRGRRWDLSNAEAVMALDCLANSGLWDKHWATPDPERN